MRPNYALRQVLADKTSVGASGSGDSPSSTDVKRRSWVRQMSGTSQKAVAGLQKNGVPWGLARLINAEDQKIALRIFLLDNSGSTNSMDGQYFSSDGKKMPCSRWEEIKHLALQQAEWNARISTPCEFILLNPPSQRPLGEYREGIDHVTVDAAQGDVTEQINSLATMLERTEPRGVTPLALRLQEIYDRVRADSLEFVKQDQRVFLVIATDGLPTGPYDARSTPETCYAFVRNLRKLTNDLPVFIVIRLTTDEAQVVKYFNQLDNEVELTLEVLDDMKHEANEIYKCGNRWLTYSPLIHRIREGGTFVKLFDLLDERKFTPPEVFAFVQLLLRDENEEVFPFEPDAFLQEVESRLPNVERVYDVRKACMAPCIDLQEVRRAMLPRGRFTTIALPVVLALAVLAISVAIAFTSNGGAY